eukprot:4269109-Lingulodinium_polyedra.AAC.1
MDCTSGRLSSGLTTTRVYDFPARRSCARGWGVVLGRGARHVNQVVLTTTSSLDVRQRGATGSNSAPVVKRL